MLLTLLGKCPIPVILTEWGGTFVFLCVHVSAWEGCACECWGSEGGVWNKSKSPLPTSLDQP